MKKIFIIFLLLGSFFTVRASENNIEYWVCNQTGELQNSNIYVTSNIFKSSTSTSSLEKEQVFENKIKNTTNNSFKPHYAAYCKNFSTEEKAVSFLKKMIEQAKKRNFNILWINFSK